MSERASSESFIGKHKKKLVAIAAGLGLAVVGGEKVLKETELDTTEQTDPDAGQSVAKTLIAMDKEKELGVSNKKEVAKEDLLEQKNKLQQAVVAQVPGARLRDRQFTLGDGSFWLSFGSKDDALAGAEVEVRIEEYGFTLYHPDLHVVSAETEEDVVKLAKIMSDPQYIAWQKAFKTANSEALNARSVARMYDQPSFNETDREGKWEEFRVVNQEAHDLQGKIEAYLEANGINLPDGYGKILVE